MHLGALIAACENQSGYNDPTFRFRWREFINSAVRDFARAHPWPGLVDEYEFTLPAGSRHWVLPQHVDHVLTILNRTDGLEVLRAGEFERRYPQTTSAGTTGRPLEWDIVGTVASVRDPTGYLTLQSTHASETFNAYVTGLAATTGASGTGLETVVKQENIALQGNTPVTLTTLFAKITSIAKETLTNGDYWILDAGASNAPVSFIPAGEIEARFRRLEFSFVPDADRSFRVKFRRKIPLLTADNQSPDPSVNSDYVIQKALALYQRHQEQFQKSVLHDAKAQEILEAESDREANFSQPFSQVIPFLPYAHDYYDDGYRGN